VEPRLLDHPVIIAIAQRLRKTPAQVMLAWAVQRGTALLTTSVTPSRIQENFELSTIREDAMQEIRDTNPTDCAKCNSRSQFTVTVVDYGWPR
jgi:diketogulonate reductase-like aldo/keto reductase